MNFWYEEKMKTTPKNEDKLKYYPYLNKWRRPNKLRWPKTEENLKNENGLKHEDTLNNEDELKNEDVLKNCSLTPQQFCPHPNCYDITWIFLKTSHLDSHTTNDVKLKMLSGVQTWNTGCLKKKLPL